MDKEQARLTSKEDWNDVWERSLIPAADKPLRAKIKRVHFLQNLRPQATSTNIRPHSEHIFWNICSKVLPRKKGLKILEVGSAPGRYLIKFNEKFGYEPYGVDYSEIGIEINRSIFALHNLDPNHVIHSDFFSAKFQAQYSDYFDIVVSRGFVEHFLNPEEVVKKHSTLLREGGICIITIPNISGINYILGFLLNRERQKQHNLAIMEKKRFGDLFKATDLSILYLDYYGVLNLRLFSAGKAYKQILVVFLLYFQLFFDRIACYFLKEKDVKSSFLSPHIICIAKKLGNRDDLSYAVTD